MINIRIVRMLFISAVAYWKGDTVVSDAVESVFPICHSLRRK